MTLSPQDVLRQDTRTVIDGFDRAAYIANPPDGSTDVAEAALFAQLDISPAPALFEKNLLPSPALASLLQEVDLHLDVAKLPSELFKSDRITAPSVAQLLAVVDAGIEFQLVPVHELTLPFVHQASQLAFFKDYHHYYSAELRPVDSEQRTLPSARCLELLIELGYQESVGFEDTHVGTLVLPGATARAIDGRLEFLAKEIARNGALDIAQVVLLGGERNILGSDSLEIFNRYDPKSNFQNATELPFVHTLECEGHRFHGQSVINEGKMVAWMWERAASVYPELADIKPTSGVEAHDTTIAAYGKKGNIPLEATVDTWLADRNSIAGNRITFVGQQPYLSRYMMQGLQPILEREIEVGSIRGIGSGTSFENTSFQELMKHVAISINLYKESIELIEHKLGKRVLSLQTQDSSKY